MYKHDKIKVFSTPSSADAGTSLTEKFEEWQKENTNCSLLDMHTTSNKYIVLLTIKYSENE